MKNKILTFICLFIISLPVYASETDNSIFVTNVEGASFYLDENKQEQPLQGFAKLSPATEIVLHKQADLQLVYLSNGQQETWKGPASFTTGTTGSENIQSETAPAVKTLPPFMLSVLMKSPEVISSIKTRQGMIRVRSLMTARKVKEAEENYRKMQRETDEKDITPEIYLITTLDELKVYNRMVRPLKTMIRKQPNNEQAKELYDQFMAVLNNEKQRIE